MKITLHQIARGKKFFSLAILVSCFQILFSLSSSAQWVDKEYHKIDFGASAGFGGMYSWGGGSFDVIYRKTTARLSPGLYFLSAGITQKIGLFQPKRRADRLLILSGYYMHDWMLSNKRGGEFRENKNIYMLMPGIHVNLNHLGTVYLEVSAGAMYVHEVKFTADRSVRQVADNFYPMGEIRLGGVFLRRIYRAQQFPMNWKEKKGKKPEKTKLKAK